MKYIKLKDLKETMGYVRERWKVQGLDIKVFFDEVLMNVKNSEAKEPNPAHYCMGNCGKYLGHRGFCSDKCHNKFYDSEAKE